MRSERQGRRARASAELSSLRRRWYAATAGVVVLAAVAAGCGSDDDGSKSASGDASGSASAPATSKKLTGAPVKITVIAPVDTPIQNNPGVPAAAKAAAMAVNNEGGINGRPIEISFCNDLSDPNKTAACSRQAVRDKSVAVVSYNVFGPSMYPILENGEVPNVGNFISTPPDWTSKMAFPLFPGANLQIGAVPFQAKAHGVHKIAGILYDMAGIRVQLPTLQLGIKAAGLEYGGDVVLPTSATDFATFAQQARGTGADLGMIMLNEQGAVKFIQASRAAGVNMTWGAQGQQIGKAHTLDPLGDLADGMLSPTGLPPLTAGDEYPAIKQFTKELDAAAAAGVDGTDDRRLTTEGAWLAVHAIAIVGRQVEGKLTNTTLIDALNKAKNVDVLGLVDWSPSVAGPAQYPRVSNDKVFFTVVKDGDFQLDPDMKPIHIFDALGLTGQ